jgi:PleD family two-component response regulator
VSFSAGLADLGADGSTLEELLAAADRRLYAAKRAGRARVMASEELGAEASR